MASREIDIYGVSVRAKDPGQVALFHILTLGIYNLFWYYRINKELRDYGELYGIEDLRKVRPGLAVLATSLGAILIVPAIMSWYNCTKRIQAVQEKVGHKPLSGWMLFALYVGGVFVVIPFPFIPYMVQQDLNQAWKAYEDAPQTGVGASTPQVRVSALPMLELARSWDTSRVTEEDLATINGYLARRGDLEAAARETMAGQLAHRIRPRVIGPDPSLEADRLLELVAAVRSGASTAPVQQPSFGQQSY